ncbi:MAG: TPM domain-containing protein [Bacteroidota bacterium]
MFNFFRKQRQFFSKEENERIVAAIHKAEMMTSGEVRLFVESKCNYVDSLDRAKEIFFNLKMDQTAERNAVLVYIAMDDRQLAVFGDEGIHKKVGDEYWKDIIIKILADFKQKNYADGLTTIIQDIGEALQKYFPYNKDTDKNELPDDIVFGK